jgi:soluble lytic murein transglycosylase-like protein/lipopolysaccharide biosynthesis regulator YciM
MSIVLTLILLAATTPFESNIDRAFAGIQNSEWLSAAAALDQAFNEQPGIFAANNFHYLRGRVAETQGDWQRARDEFKKIAADNPLYAAAIWHAAWSSMKLRDARSTAEFLALLPRDFPVDLKIQLARESGGSIALTIYQDLSTREARYERARAAGDNAMLWLLIRENKDDDVALASVRTVGRLAVTGREQMDAAEVFANHRQFEDALALYRLAAADSEYVADARFRIARIHFQQENYGLALEAYNAIVKDFPDTDWVKDAKYQIASCYWRLADYKNSEKSYQDYIRTYGRTGMREAATRNLIDVYRVLGENQKAITTLDSALATQLSVSTRQVFLFTKAKILYSQKRYTAALNIFQQLARTKLRSAPGSATADEVEYFQALCQSKLGNNVAAKTIWRKLARDEFSYYGQRAAEKLGSGTDRTSPPVCLSEQNSITKAIEADVASLRHPLREALDSSSDLVSELVFLRLWDEAAYWMNRANTPPPRRQAADIAFLGGQFNRAISLADRLPKNQATLPLVYPAGFRKLICDAAASRKVDPLWLHAIIWQESKYDASARSGAAARGLMQFIPETARDVAASIGMPGVSVEKLYEPEVSIQLGAAYWSSLMQTLKTPEMALAAYNGGPDNATRWASKSDDPELFVADIGFVETKKYVMLVFAARAAYGALVN